MCGFRRAATRLLRETITTTAANGTVTTKVLDFAYDAQGTPYSLTCTNGTATPETYYYITNLQGNVTYLINGSGTTVARYSYDPYGQIQLSFGSMAEINPLRYRGYYYDSDTEFYYLQSRYYDADICRFINADAYTVSSREFTGYNMFAYCGNNPVSRTDSGGDSWWGWVAAVAVVAACAVAVVATAGGAAAAVTAVTAVANGCAATTAASTVAAGAFVGASTALAGTAVIAACESESLDDFAAYGETALLMTTFGAASGAMEARTYKPGNCFIAGTLVMAQEGNIPIEEIAVGDYVWAWDEETGDVALKQVVETYVNETEELIHLSVNGEEVTCTPGHPFYSPVKGWTDATKLRAGDILVLVNGKYVVVEWVQHELLESPVKVYNFQVADYHTYYVTDAGVLVHNKCSNNGYEAPKGGGGKKDSVQVGDTTVTFGHGGRHLKGTELTTAQVNQAIANNVVTQSVPTTVSSSYNIMVGGYGITYRAIQRAKNLIYVGTYYLTPQ